MGCREARNLHQRADQVQLGPHLDRGGRFTGVGGEYISETTHLGIFLWTPFSVVLSSSLSLCPCPWSYLGYLIFFLFLFRSCANCIKPVFCSGRQNTWRPRASNKWSLWWPVQRPRACMTSFEEPWPSQSLPWLLAHLCLRGTCRCLLLQSHVWQPKRPKLSHLSANPRGWHTHWDDTSMRHCRSHPLDLLVLGQGLSWGTLILSWHYLFSCAPCPSGHKAVMSLYPITFFNTNAFRWHAKQTHCSGSLGPT